jgi:riboflavin biosynthesis pyrimidine reductase
VRGIGSGLDRALMRRIRAACDAVMVGAATLRAEPVDPSVPDELADTRAARGLPPQPLAVAVSATLDLDPSWRFFRPGRDRALVLTTTAAPRDRADALAGVGSVERIGADSVDLVEALVRLRSGYGVERLVVEGGPTLNRQLVALGTVDELFLTLAPKLAGGSGPSIIGGGSDARILAGLELRSLHACNGELFLRYRIAGR